MAHEERVMESFAPQQLAVAPQNSRHDIVTTSLEKNDVKTARQQPQRARRSYTREWERQRQYGCGCAASAQVTERGDSGILVYLNGVRENAGIWTTVSSDDA
ncbi:uncharacterized protein DS421_10g288620 [Arachis hypogaea]|nr:uncharacterized protein DS421_10g288620 [Arachis hypogaea]